MWSRCVATVLQLGLLQDVYCCCVVVHRCSLALRFGREPTRAQSGTCLLELYRTQRLRMACICWCVLNVRLVHTSCSCGCGRIARLIATGVRSAHSVLRIVHSVVGYIYIVPIFTVRFGIASVYLPCLRTFRSIGGCLARSCTRRTREPVNVYMV